MNTPKSFNVWKVFLSISWTSFTEKIIELCSMPKNLFDRFRYRKLRSTFVQRVNHVPSKNPPFIVRFADEDFADKVSEYKKI